MTWKGSHGGVLEAIRSGARATLPICGILWAFAAQGSSGEEGRAGPDFRFHAVSKDSLGLWDGNRPVLVYNHGMIGKEGVPARYNRSCYVHPLHGLDGEILTDDFPKDHYHHRGLFWAWPHVRIEGKEYDSWIPSGIQLKFEGWVRKEAGKSRAVLGVENGWYVGDEKVVSEKVLIIVHPAGDDERAIDVELTWTPTGKPVTLRGAENKSYGGLTLRFAPREETTITVPSGRTKEDLAVTRLPWADFTGRFAGSPGRSGVALFIDKTHPDFPPTWLTRHYGALCVGWPGVEPGTLEAGKPVRCAYRLWVHRGDPPLAELRRAYKEYTERAADGSPKGR